MNRLRHHFLTDHEGHGERFAKCDPKSWLVTHRRDVRPLHVDIDPTPTTIEQRMSDFRQVAGVWFPFANTETDLKTGKVLETTTIRSITINPKIDEAIFEKL